MRINRFTENWRLDGGCALEYVQFCWGRKVNFMRSYVVCVIVLFMLHNCLKIEEKPARGNRWHMKWLSNSKKKKTRNPIEHQHNKASFCCELYTDTTHLTKIKKKEKTKIKQKNVRKSTYITGNKNQYSTHIHGARTIQCRFPIYVRFTRVTSVWIHFGSPLFFTI